MSHRFMTVSRLMRETGLSFQRAEAIIGEQTRACRGRPRVSFVYLSMFLMSVVGVPLLVPAGDRGLGLALRAVGLLGMIGAGVVLPRVLAREAILDAARADRTTPQAWTREGDTTR